MLDADELDEHNFMLDELSDDGLIAWGSERPSPNSGACPVDHNVCR
jgi:hypothetical protein